MKNITSIILIMLILSFFPIPNITTVEARAFNATQIKNERNKFSKAYTKGYTDGYNAAMAQLNVLIAPTKSTKPQIAKVVKPIIPLKKSSRRKISLKDLINDKPFWDTMWAYESGRGKNLYQRRDRSCNTTNRPCGHFQLYVGALSDIGENNYQGKKCRASYSCSIRQARKYLKIIHGRLPKYYRDRMVVEDYFTLHNQGNGGYVAYKLMSSGRKAKNERAILRALYNNIGHTSKRGLKYRYKTKSGKTIWRYNKTRVVAAYKAYWSNRWQKQY